MKHTPFTQNHVRLGAKMADFAGYYMPISYTSIKEEHATVRSVAGVFDVSHMGEFIIKGENAVDLIQHLTTNDISKISSGKAQYSCMLNKEGGIIDDIIIYCLEENKEYMIVANASNIEKDWNWITAHNTKNAAMQNISYKTGLLAVQGPEATRILQPLTNMDLLNLKYYTFVKGEFAGVGDVIISATGYTGSGGVEIYFEDNGDNAQKIWNKIFEVGHSQGMRPIGLAARDTLRLEMGYCLYGNDIDDTTSPLEAGLGWITKTKKGDFIGKGAVEKLKEAGISRKLVGIEMLDKGVPRTGYEITDESGNKAGHVTSGTQSPSLQKPIALGYVNVENASIGTSVNIKVRDKLIASRIVKVPFE